VGVKKNLVFHLHSFRGAGDLVFHDVEHVGGAAERPDGAVLDPLALLVRTEGVV
jgi:hypothetical protein